MTDEPPCQRRRRPDARQASGVGRQLINALLVENNVDTFESLGPVALLEELMTPRPVPQTRAAGRASQGALRDPPTPVAGSSSPNGGAEDCARTCPGRGPKPRSA